MRRTRCSCRCTSSSRPLAPRARRRDNARRTDSRTRSLPRALEPAPTRLCRTTDNRSMTALLRDRRARASRPHLGRKRGDVVGAVMPPAVDEERRRARDAAQIGGVHVLRDAGGARPAVAGRPRTARRRGRAPRRSRSGRSEQRVLWSSSRSCISQNAPCAAAASAASAAACARGCTSVSGRCRQT